MSNVAKIIQRMHTEIVDMGDESVYERWVQIVPDEPTTEDFEFIAEDDELCEMAVDFFFNNYRP